MVHDSGFSVDLNRHYAERHRVLSECVRLAHTGVVDGDIAEFGVAHGHSLEVIAETVAQCDTSWPKFRLKKKSLHGYDSFAGLPESTLPGDVDSPMVQMKIWGAGKCGSPGISAVLAKVNKHLSPDRVSLYPGWFKDTLHTTDPKIRFSLVHIDCDLYESARDVLEFLFTSDRLSDGCIMLFDDFLQNRASKKFGQRKAWGEALETWCPDFTDLGFYALGCWHCIIHRE